MYIYLYVYIFFTFISLFEILGGKRADDRERVELRIEYLSPVGSMLNVM